MSILRLLALLVTLLAPGVALACSCMWSGPFTKVALGTDLVVLAEVRSYHRHSMDVAVLRSSRAAKTGGRSGSGAIAARSAGPT